MVLTVQTNKNTKINYKGNDYYFHMGSLAANKITITLLDSNLNPVKKTVVGMDIEISITIDQDLIGRSSSVSIREIFKICLVESGLCKDLNSAEDILKDNDL